MVISNAEPQPLDIFGLVTDIGNAIGKLRSAHAALLQRPGVRPLVGIAIDNLERLAKALQDDLRKNL